MPAVFVHAPSHDPKVKAFLQTLETDSATAPAGSHVARMLAVALAANEVVVPQ
jgi:hypothetical protein